MKLPAFRLTMVSLFAACGGGGDGGEGTAEVAGVATYRDATTTHDGQARDPEAPPAQSMRVRVVVEGQGTLPEVDPRCALDPAGQFEARYAGTTSLSNDGIYATALAAGTAELVTPSGCEIPDLIVGFVTDVRVRGELSVTTENCQTYCAAAARAEAEQSCGASANAAACRAEAEASGEASCMTTCTTQTHVIVAETSLGATAVGQLDVIQLRAAALGQIEADLVFDHLEDERGSVLDF
jgi:hypothetical protein